MSMVAVSGLRTTEGSDVSRSAKNRCVPSLNWSFTIVTFLHITVGPVDENVTGFEIAM